MRMSETMLRQIEIPSKILLSMIFVKSSFNLKTLKNTKKNYVAWAREIQNLHFSYILIQIESFNTP